MNVIVCKIKNFPCRINSHHDLNDAISCYIHFSDYTFYFISVDFTLVGVALEIAEK